MAFFVKSIHFTENIRCNVAYLQTIVFEMFPSVIFFPIKTAEWMKKH